MLYSAAVAMVEIPPRIRRAQMEIAFLIADLAGYTALTEAHGGEGAAHVIARYTAVAAQARLPSVRLVERAGDALLMAGEAIGDVVVTAVRLRDAVERQPLFPEVCVGLDVGAAIERDGGFFGTPLNVAARVAAHARPGQVLCTDRIVAAAQPHAFEFRQLGPVRLRNVAAPVMLFEVATTRADEGIAIDPVCRMRVTIDGAPARLPYGDRSWFFCSFDCARAFAERPEDHAGT